MLLAIVLEIHFLMPVWKTSLDNWKNWSALNWREESEPGGDSSEDEDDDRIEAMLVGACSHSSTAGPSTMPSNRDSLLLLDPDLHDFVLVIF